MRYLIFLFFLLGKLQSQQLNWVNVMPTEHAFYFGPAEVAVLSDSAVVGFFGYIDDAENDFVFDFDLGPGEAFDLASLVKYDKNGNYVMHKSYPELFPGDSILIMDKSRMQVLNHKIIFTGTISVWQADTVSNEDFVFCFDHQLNILWSKRFLRNNSGAQGMVFTPDSNFVEHRSFWNVLNGGHYINFSRGVAGGSLMNDSGQFLQWFPMQKSQGLTGLDPDQVFVNEKTLALATYFSTNYSVYADTIDILNLSLNQNSFVPDTTTFENPTTALLIFYENSSLNYRFHRKFTTNASLGFGPVNRGMLLDTAGTVYLAYQNYTGAYNLFSYSISENNRDTIDLNESSNTSLFLKLDSNGYVRHWVRTDPGYQPSLGEIAVQSLFYLDKNNVLQCIGTGRSNTDFDWDEQGVSVISGPNSLFTPAFASYDSDFNYLGHTIIRPQNANSYAIVRSYQTDSLGRTTMYGEFMGSANFQIDTTLAPAIRTYNGGLETEFIATYTTVYPILIDTLKSKGFCVGDSSILLQVQANAGVWDYVWQVKVGDVYKNIYNSNAYSGLHTATLTIHNPTQDMNGQQYRCWIGRGNGWVEAGTAILFEQSNASATFTAQYNDFLNVTLQANEQGPFQNTWILGDGTTITNQLTVNHTYQSPGQFEVIHIISSACGADTSSQNILIQPVSVEPIVNNDAWFVHQQGSVLIINSNNQTQELVEIYSLDGRLIHQEKMYSNSLAVPTQNLSRGIYLVKLGNSAKKAVVH